MLLKYIIFFLPLRYTPTRLWGYSGHVQTIIGGVISLFRCPLLNGKRFALRASDGATVTYDLYQPLDKHQNDGTCFNILSISYLKLGHQFILGCCNNSFFVLFGIF